MYIRFNRKPAPFPRHVSFTLCCEALFANWIVLFGWAVFGFSFVIIWHVAFASFAFLHFIGALSYTTGTITSDIVFQQTQNGNMMPATIEYTFTPRGASVPISIKTDVRNLHARKGMQVTIAYRTNRPEFSRIQGAQNNDNLGILIAFLFPLIGLTMIIISLVRGIRSIVLLHKGCPALGTLHSVKPTGIVTGECDANPIYRLDFRFTLDNKREYQASYFTAKIKPAWEAFYQHSLHRCNTTPGPATTITGLHTNGEGNILQRVERTRKSMLPPVQDISELQEVVLYHPANPAFARIAVGFAPEVFVDLQGRIHGEQPWIGILSSVIPALVIVATIWTLYSTLHH